MDDNGIKLLLIVDDDEYDRKAISRSLRKDNIDIDIDEVPDCRSCLIAIQKKKYDCIIIDYLLPDCNGLELIHDIKKMGIDIPIIATTGHGDEMLVVQMLKIGAYDYIPKDKITPELMIRTIEGAIKYHQVEKDKLKAESNYQTLYDTAPIGLWRTAISNGKFISLNKYCKDILGFKEGIDIHACDLYKDKNKREELLDDLHKHGEIKDFEIEIVLPDGSHKWISLTAKIYENKDYLEGCLRDITKEKMMEEELKDLKEQMLSTLSSIREDVHCRMENYATAEV